MSHPPLIINQVPAGDIRKWPYSIIDWLRNLRSILLMRTPRLVRDVSGNVNITLLPAEYYNVVMEFTGILTGNINIVVPIIFQNLSECWQWTVFNNTTGAFTLTIKTTLGTGITIGQGKRAIVYCDGTNVVRVTADV